MENTSTTTVEIESPGWLRRFAPLWIGQAFSMLGSGLVQFALVWYLTAQTGSTAVLATATIAALLPQVLLGPFAGALVDRWNRKIVMMVSDSVTALATLALVVLFMFGKAQIWHIYAAMFVRSLGGAFQWPAMQASTTLMVPKKHLSRLAGANQALQGLITIGAPPLGALLISFLPMFSVLAIDIVTAFIAVGILFFITIPQPVHNDEVKSVTMTTMVKDVRVGLRYVAAWPGLMGVIVMAALVNFFFSPASSFIPLLVTRHFNGNAAQYGWMDSAFGFGIVAGGLLLSLWGGFRRKVYTAMSGLIGMGVGISAIGLAPSSGYILALGGMLFMGTMNSLTNGPLFALLQDKVEPEMQGRVFTLLNSGAQIMMPISMIIATPLADWLGLQSWYLIAAAACVVMAVYGLVNKNIATLDQQQPGGSAVSVEPIAPPLVAD